MEEEQIVKITLNNLMTQETIDKYKKYRYKITGSGINTKIERIEDETLDEEHPEYIQNPVVEMIAIEQQAEEQ